MGASFAFLASWSPWCRGLGRTWLGPRLHRSAKVAGKLVRAAFFHQSCRWPSRPCSPRVPLCLACAKFVGACNCHHFACCFRCGPWLCSSRCQALEGTLRSPSLSDHKLSHASGRIKSTAIIGHFLPMPSWPRFLFKHSLLLQFAWGPVSRIRGMLKLGSGKRPFLVVSCLMFSLMGLPLP